MAPAAEGVALREGSEGGWWVGGMSLGVLKGEGNGGKGKVKEALDAPQMRWEFWLRSSSSCLLRFLSWSANNGARIDLQGQKSRAARTPRLYSLTRALPEARWDQ